MTEENEKFPAEVYRLTLDHYFDDGESHQRLEEPLVVQMIWDRRFVPQAICLNRMIDMMRSEVLKRAGEQGWMI